MTLDDLHDRLIDTVVSLVLNVPDLSVIRVANDLSATANGLTTEGLELQDTETGHDNHREVRSLDRDLDTVKSQASDLHNTLVQEVLIAPMEKALTAVSEYGVEWDRWSPIDWLNACRTQDLGVYKDAVALVMAHARAQDLPHWYSAINDQSPVAGRPVQQRELWEKALERSRNRGLVEQAVALYLDDDTLSETRESKLKSLQRKAFQAYYEQNMSVLQDHLWSTQGPDLEYLAWDKVVDSMLRETRRHSDNGRHTVAHQENVRFITQWMTRLTSTGALDAWLSEPQQWTPVQPPASPSQGRATEAEIATWMKQHVQNGSFTWSVLIAGFEALGQPMVAVSLRQIGERWSLAHDVGQALENAPAANRQRARL